MNDNLTTIEAEIARRLKNAQHLTADELHELAAAQHYIHRARNDDKNARDERKRNDTILTALEMALTFADNYWRGQEGRPPSIEADTEA